jgi:sugar O-acyltransferase (sialic acid O-acetyltransferase NeuD family)
MSELLIVGCGDFGREVLNYALDAGQQVRGFLDDDPRACNVPKLGVAFLGVLEQVSFDAANDRFVIAVGDAVARKSLAMRVRSRGGHLASVVHPTAYVARDASIGQGCIVGPFAMVATNACVAENTALNTYASVGHGARVGAHCVFSPYSVINGNVQLGERVFLGTHATVTPGCSVGAMSKVSAGAVVTRGVEPGSLVSGNPAKGRVMFLIPDE